MKITDVEIHPSNSPNVALLSFLDPTRANPYNVVSMTGLDADNIVAKYYGDSAFSPSIPYYSLSMEDREIVIRVQLNPDFSIGKSYGDLRDDFYKMISSSRTGLLQLQFKNEADVVAAISGFVSKLEAPQFEKTQEVQLTIKPTDPMLRGLDWVDVDVTGFDPDDFTVLDDISTAPHGFFITFEFSDFLETFSLLDNSGDIVNSGWSFDVSPVGGFGDGDILNLYSEANDKQLFITRGPSIIHLGDVIKPKSVWPIIFPGANLFTVQEPELMTITSIGYYTAFWGV